MVTTKIDPEEEIGFMHVDQTDFDAFTLGQRLRHFEVEGYVVLPDVLDAAHIQRLKKELANVPSVRRIPHGVTVSPDGQLAFVTVEGVGGDPGSVEVLDLRTFRRLAVIDVGKQASGIDFWKIGP